MNPNDDRRDKFLRFLYERHQTATGITAIPRSLDELDQSIAESAQLTDEQKLDAAGDIAAIRAQAAKKNPNSSLIQGAWEGLKSLPVLGQAADAVRKVGKLLGELLS